MGSFMSIMVLVTLPADDYSPPVRTPVTNHVILALPVLPVIGLVRFVADIADALCRVVTRVPLAQSIVDGIVNIVTIAAICRARYHVISFLVIVAAKRNW